MKKIILGSLGIISIGAASFVILAANANSNSNERRNDVSVVGNTPNSVYYYNKRDMTFTNPRHYQYNFKDSSGEYNYYFNQGMNINNWWVKVNYANNDYSIATLKMKGEGDNKFENQDDWYEEEQEWEATFNRTANYLKMEGWKADKWSNSPRFGIVISKSLELVPNSMVITAYKSTKGEDVFATVKPDYLTNEVVTNSESKKGLHFKRNDIITGMPIPNQYNHNDWIGKLTSFNRWTTWLNTDYKIDPKMPVSDWYKERIYAFNNGKSADNQPIRAWFLHTWRGELEREIQRQSSRNLYPPKSIVVDPKGEYNSKMLNNAGTIIGFGYNTGVIPTGGEYYDDQNWFKITFKTRKNKLLFDNKNAGDLAYVMAGFTTFDDNTHIYSFNWKAADINQDQQNYSVDIKEFKEKESEYKLPKSIKFELYKDDQLIPDSGIFLESNNTKGTRNSSQDVDTWYSRTYNTIRLDDGNMHLWKDGNNQKLLKTWKIKPAISNPEEEIWDLDIKSHIDPNSENRLVFEVKYKLNELKVEKKKALTLIPNSFNHLNELQKQHLTKQIENANDINDLRRLINVNNNNNGEIKNLNQKMGDLKNLLTNVANKENQNHSYDSETKKAFDALKNQIQNDLKKNLTKDQVQNHINKLNRYDKLADLGKYIDGLSNLTNNQKTLLKNKTKDEFKKNNTLDQLTQALNKLKEQSTTLNANMGKLKTTRNQADSVKTTGKYSNASKQYKDAFDAAHKESNNFDSVIDPAKIKSLNDNLSQSINNLDGQKNIDDLNGAKKAAKENLALLTNLNELQRNEIIADIDKQTTVAGVKSIIDYNKNNAGTAKDLDNAMGILKEQIATSNTVKNSDQYNYADPKTKPPFDATLTNANAEVKKKINKDKALKLAKNLKQNTDSLNGIQNKEKLNKRKENLINKIQGDNNLTEAQKTNLIARVKEANETKLNEIEPKITTLSTQMAQLRKVQESAKLLENSDKYKNATPLTRSALSGEITKNNNFIGDTSPDEEYYKSDDVDQITNEINKLINSTNQAMTNLEEKAKENLNKEKTNAKNKINNEYTHLNNEQKAFLNRQIDDATLISTSDHSSIDKIIKRAQKLDDLMGKLKVQIEDSTNIKSDVKYNYSDDEYKTPFDEALENANKEVLKNIDATIVEELTNDLVAKTNALNGTTEKSQLPAQKQDLINKINNNEYLSQAQKNNLVKKVEGVNNTNDFESMKNDVELVSSKMQTLRELQNKTKDIQKGDDYKNSGTLAQGTLNSEITKNDNFILDNSDDEDYYNANGVDQINKKIEEHIKNTNDAINGLQRVATQNLNEAIKNALEKINANPNLNYPYLNNAQKEHFKSQIKSAKLIDSNTSNSIKGIEKDAQITNDSMKVLYDYVENVIENGNNSNPYNQNKYTQTNSESLKDNFKDSYTKALDVLNKTTGKNLTKEDVSNLFKKLKVDYEALNGEEAFAQEQERVKQEIESLDLLNRAQKDLLIKQVESKNTTNDLENHLEFAKQVNNAMANLNAENAKEINPNRKNTNNYINSSETKRLNYDNALEQLQNVSKIGESSSHPKEALLDVDQINNLIQNLRNAVSLLDGDNKLTEEQNDLINQIIADPNLNQSQKDKLIQKTKESSNEKDISKVKDIVDKLSTKMQELRNTQNDAKNLQNTDVYKNANHSDKNTLIEDIDKNDQMINSILDSDVDWDSLNDTIDTLVNKTKEDMSNLTDQANERLNKTKTKALEHLEELDKLNNAQKSHYKDLIDNSTLIDGEDLNSIAKNLKDAVNLNDAMSHLNDYINLTLRGGNDSDPKQNDNYVSAQDNLKTNFDDSLNDALVLLDKDRGSNLDIDETNEILTKLRQDFEALDGKARKDKSTKELEELVNEYDQFIGGSSYIESPSDEKDNYNKAITKGKEILNNLDAVNNNDILEAINKIKEAKENILSQDKDDFKDQIDNLNNLTDVEKQNFKDKIDQSDSSDKIKEILQNAKDLNNKKQELIDHINASENLSDSDKSKLVDSVKNKVVDDLKDLDIYKEEIKKLEEAISKLVDPNINTELTNDQIDKIMDIINNSIIENPNYQKIANQLKHLNNLKDALKAYRDSSVVSPDYENLKAELEKQINLPKEIVVNDSKLEKVNNQINTKLEMISKLGDAEIKIVDALLHHSTIELQDSINLLKKVDNTRYSEFIKQLNDVEYFDHVAIPAVKMGSLFHYNKVKDIKQVDASNVIYSAHNKLIKDMFNNIPERLSIFWFVGLFIFAITSIATALGLYKVNKNK